MKIAKENSPIEELMTIYVHINLQTCFVTGYYSSPVKGSVRPERVKSPVFAMMKNSKSTPITEESFFLPK